LAGLPSRRDVSRHLMARFYFHLQEADELYIDPEGTEIPDVDAARQEALLAARDILGKNRRLGKVNGLRDARPMACPPFVRNKDGGHGDKCAFAHPTRLFQALDFRHADIGCWPVLTPSGLV
jgi:hypothetical protein